MTSQTPRRAVIFHGYGATPDDHWFGWLAGRLTRSGISTTIPTFPDPAAPDASRWAAVAEAALGMPGPDMIVIAHSLGSLTALRHLGTLSGPWRLGALVLVSGFVDKLPALPQLDDVIGEGADVRGIREHVGSITLLRSDADPYVPVGHTDRLARLLGTSAVVVPGAGHFLAADGVTTLPAAVRAIVNEERRASSA